MTVGAGATVAGWLTAPPADLFIDPAALVGALVPIFLENLLSIALLVGSQMATCGVAGVLFIAVNGYRAGALAQSVPMVLWWAAGEIAAASFAAAGGLVLAVAFWRWLLRSEPVDPGVWPASGRSFGLAVAMLAAAAVVEALLPKWETR